VFSSLFLNSPSYSNFGGDSVDAESHSSSTESTPSETPRQPSQQGVRLYSTESTLNDEIFVNVGVFCVGSVDVESHSALTQVTGVSLRFDSVDGESNSGSAQGAEDESNQKRHT
jgi:hypothetical protein